MENVYLKGYAKCICGAITIFTTAHDYSCKQINLKKFFPVLICINLKDIKLPIYAIIVLIVMVLTYVVAAVAKTLENATTVLKNVIDLCKKSESILMY